MNIHFIGPDRVDTASYRRRKGERGPTAKGTKPPRTRPGQTYPGGKHMRRALKELSRRQSAREATVSGTRRGGKSLDYNLAFQMPGSMKTRAR
jgi:hypothetical protein